MEWHRWLAKELSLEPDSFELVSPELCDLRCLLPNFSKLQAGLPVEKWRACHLSHRIT